MQMGFSRKPAENGDGVNLQFLWAAIFSRPRFCLQTGRPWHVDRLSPAFSAVEHDRLSTRRGQNTGARVILCGLTVSIDESV